MLYLIKIPLFIIEQIWKKKKWNLIKHCYVDRCRHSSYAIAVAAASVAVWGEMSTVITFALETSFMSIY